MRSRKWRLLGTLLILISSVLGSCTPSVLEPLPQAEVVDLADSCLEMIAKQISAWDSRDEDQLREVYTEDIVHFDGGPAYVGIDRVSGMARWMWENYGDWKMAPGETYIAADDCLGTSRDWDVFGFEEKKPGLEFDLIDFKDGKISFWRLFYSEQWMVINKELLTQFAEVWSARNTPGLEEIYAQDAVLEDSLMGVEAVGLEEITAYAQALKKGYSLGSWDLLIPFAESENPVPDLQAAKGGVYQITTGRDGCLVQAAVILSANQEGKIAHQLTLYQVDSLQECGWITQ